MIWLNDKTFNSKNKPVAFIIFFYFFYHILGFFRQFFTKFVSWQCSQYAHYSQTCLKGYFYI